MHQTQGVNYAALENKHRHSQALNVKWNCFKAYVKQILSGVFYIFN